MFKRWLSAGLILLAVCLGSRAGVARADDDYTDALSRAPQGILINQTNPFITTETTSKSSATVVNGTNPETPGTQVAVLTKDTNQFGALWSTDAGYLALNQNQTLSMWLYLGDQDAQAAEGLAFVLQNDEHGLAAMPQAGKGGQIPGETLGVWAVDNDPRQGVTTKFPRTAIQNSWALEFDTHFNDETAKEPAGKANAFDTSYPAVHIASNFPALPTTYVQHFTDYGFWNGLFSGNDYYYSMIHDGLISNVNAPNFLANGQWHHLTLKWEAKAEMMTYTFDDRDPQTDEQLSGVSKTVRIMPARIDPFHTNKVRWGFTSATEGRSGNNLVVLENIPGLIDADSRGELTDLTRHRLIKTGDQVLQGDQLQLAYQLTYHQGRQPWADIRANLKLPENFDVTGGKITYQNAKRPPQTIAATDVKDGHLSVRLTSELDAENAGATITLTGHAGQVAHTTTVPAATSAFTSTARVTSADTPEFIINPGTDVELKVTSLDSVHLKPGASTTVTGNVTVSTTAEIPPTTIVLPTLNGRRIASVPVAADGSFNLALTADQLQAGTNQLSLVAITVLGDASRPVTVPITVAGTLQFATISANQRFQETQLTGSSQLVKRTNDWQLAVQDTRGTGEQWTLLAQATPFTTPDGRQLAGQPVYVTKYQTIPLGANPTPVVSHVTDDSVNDGLYDVAGVWQPNTGVLLRVHGAAMIGRYQGTITWALANAPQ